MEPVIKKLDGDRPHSRCIKGCVNGVKYLVLTHTKDGMKRARLLCEEHTRQIAIKHQQSMP